MSSAYDCKQPVDIADEPHHHLVIANQYIRAFAVEVPPHTKTLCHRHPSDYMIYVAQGAQIISAARDDEPKQLHYIDGECELSKAGLIHVVDNVSDVPFRNVVVELQPEDAGLKRGDAPRVTDGEVAIEQILTDERGAVLTIDMDPGGEIELSGPAVLGAPYAPVMVRELEEFDIPLDDFRKLMWVCAPRSVGVRNTGGRAARMVVFNIGA